MFFGEGDETINHIISEGSKLAHKEFKTRNDWRRVGDPLGIGQEIEVWTYDQMVYVQPRICPEEWDKPTSLGLWYTNGSPNIGRTTTA